MIKGGHIVGRDFLEREVTPKLGPVEIQIGDDQFITPITADETGRFHALQQSFL